MAASRKKVLIGQIHRNRTNYNQRLPRIIALLSFSFVHNQAPLYSKYFALYSSKLPIFLLCISVAASTPIYLKCHGSDS